MSERPQSFFIELAYGVNSFYAGQRIQGRVVLILSEPRRCKGMTIELRGSSLTNLMATSTAHLTPEYDPTSICVYNSPPLSLLQPGQLTEKGMMNAGRYEWPFSIDTNAAASLPPSFEGRQGVIRYLLHARFQRGTFTCDNIAKLPITIVPAVDANLPIHTAPKTVRIVNKVTAWLGFGDRGEITSEMALPHTGYITGDTLELRVRLENKVTGGAKDTVKRASLILLQKVRYITETSLEVDQPISEMPLLAADETVAPGQVLEKVVSFVVPLTTPSFTYKSLCVWHVIKLKCETTASYPYFSEIPFVICTFRSEPCSQTQQLEQLEQQHQQMVLPPAHIQGPTPETPLYSMGAPPAYEDIVAEQECVGFQPSYALIAPSAPPLYAVEFVPPQPAQVQQQPPAAVDLHLVTPAAVEQIVAPSVPQMCGVTAPVASTATTPDCAATTTAQKQPATQQPTPEATSAAEDAVIQKTKPVKKTARKKAVAL